jgi:hypothetical protein
MWEAGSGTANFAARFPHAPLPSLYALAPGDVAVEGTSGSFSVFADDIA